MITIPAVESQYVISLEEIFWGGTLVAVTMAMHGLGMLSTLRVNGALKQRFAHNPTFAKGMLILIVTSWVILLIHLLEVFAWAGFFLWKGAVNAPQVNASLCYYFALLDYTCLGSNYNLRLPWRLLEGMIAMAGLLTFAWSTGVLMTLAQDFQDQQMQLLKQKREKRYPKQNPAPPPAGKPS
jgi:hypothetical protein